MPASRCERRSRCASSRPVGRAPGPRARLTRHACRTARAPAGAEHRALDLQQPQLGLRAALGGEAAAAALRGQDAMARHDGRERVVAERLAHRARRAGIAQGRPCRRRSSPAPARWRARRRTRGCGRAARPPRPAGRRAARRAGRPARVAGADGGLHRAAGGAGFRGTGPGPASQARQGAGVVGSGSWHDRMSPCAVQARPTRPMAVSTRQQPTAAAIRPRAATGAIARRPRAAPGKDRAGCALDDRLHAAAHVAQCLGMAEDVELSAAMASNTFCATSAAVILPDDTALSLIAWPISWLRWAWPAAGRRGGCGGSG
jgi:hypothetical protein